MELLWNSFIFVYILAVALATTQDLGCDPGWLIAFGSCFYFNNQKLVTWSEATHECDGFDSSPVFFKTSDELAWYRNVTQTQFPSSGYWTSMNDLVGWDTSTSGTGHWTWGKYMAVDISTIQWSSSPANDGRPFCGAISLNGRMYDADCNSRQGYICMMETGVQQYGCPFDWLISERACYYVGNTSDPGQLKTWSQARAWCPKLNPRAYLFVLDGANDQNFLDGDLPYLSKNSYLFWTGLQGNGKAGGLTWVNGVPVNQQLLKWVVEPDNVAGIEDCGVIRFNGKFSDRGCNIKQNYICRKPQLSVDTSWNLGCGLWTRAGSICYQFYTDPRSTWMDAKQMCKSMQGDLINVNDLDIKEWLFEQLMDPEYDNDFWTALNDRDTEGVYKWGDGSVLDPTTINWNEEPNNWWGDEDCGLLFVTGGFNDGECWFHAAPLCELDGVQTCPSSAIGSWVSRPSDSGIGHDCYFFGSYSKNSTLMTQQEAADFCATMSVQSLDQYGVPTDVVPTLYIVNSQAERDFIKQQLQNYQDNTYGFWTALNDLTSEGFWQFGNDPTLDTSLVDWVREPNSDTEATDCVLAEYAANFHVVECNKKYPFICERPANLPWNTNSASPPRGHQGFVTVTVFLTSIALLCTTL